MPQRGRREFLKAATLAGGSLALAPARLAVAEDAPSLPSQPTPSERERAAYRERTR
jgi:hypothetical protein